MNQISHKQAVKLIHRRLDGLLKQKQLSWLDEHLRSCDSCAAYAAEMDLLPAQLQNEFHARWDEKPGPSQKVMQHVTTKARNIPMKNRISAGVKLFAGAAALILLAFVINFFVSGLRDTFTTATGTEIVNVRPRAEDRLLAFASEQSGNVDIYAMHADGSELTNLTNDPAQDANPFWSPDGKQIAFESDRSGVSQIYLMDADGSNVVQLTTDEAAHYLPMNVDGLSDPWSPDGSKILFLQSNPDPKTWTLIAQNIQGGDRTSLVTGQLYYNGISWSPDGNHIGYLLDSSPNSPPLTPAIYVTDANGSETRDLEELLPQNEGMDSRYRWSAEAGSLIFTTRRLDPPHGTAETVAYEYDLGSNTLLQDNSKKMTEWEEVTSLITAFRSFERSGLISVRQFPDGTGNTFDVDSQCLEQNIRSSPRGDFAIGAYCPDHQFRLYWANADRSTIIRQLPDFPIPYEQDTFFDLVWSPDDRYLAFNVTSLDETNLYVLDMEKALSDPSIQPVQMSISSEFSWVPSWQPVLDNKVAEEKPTPVATARSSDRLLAFASTQNGISDIYTMHADGSGLTNLTNDPAYDGSPFWSPDGKQIAFTSDRSGSTQIHLMDADGSNITQLTHDEGGPHFDINGYIPWSPDGTQLIFVNKLPEEQDWKLYVLDIDGGHTTTLTNEPGEYLLPSWSPDGEHIAFISASPSYRTTRDIFVVDKEGNNLTHLTRDLPNGAIFVFGDYAWSRNGESITFTADTNTFDREAWQANSKSTVYRASLDGSLTIVTSADKPIIAWQSGRTLLRDIEGKPSFSWLRSDGSQSSLELCGSNDRASNIAYKQSNAGNLVLGANCSASGWILYWTNPDGTLTSKLMESMIPARNDILFHMIWSPDDRFIAFISTDSDSSNSTTTLYVLDIEQARKDPSTPPLKMEAGYGPSWQPVVSPTVVEEKPAPVATAQSTAQTDSRHLVFASDSNGAFDIFITRPDGSEPVNLTDHHANDDYPFWSPDGTRIAFESDRSGSNQIYLMDADGSNVVRVTEGETEHRFLNVANPWSPDGTRLLVMERTDPGSAAENDEWTLYAMNLDGQDKASLARMPVIHLRHASWSPDGEHIALITGAPTDTAGPRFHIVNADGSNLIDMTESLPANESLWAYIGYYWSQDGQSVFFIAYRHIDEGKDQWIAYEFSLEDRQLIEKAVSSTPMGDWWEGTSFVTGFAAEREAPLTWLRSDGTHSTLKPFEKCELADEPQYGATYQRSSNGNLVIAALCPGGEWWLYWSNPDGTLVKQLLDAPIVAEDLSFSTVAWSPDDKFITFNVISNDLMNIYMLDVAAALNDPSTQPIKVTTNGGKLFYHPSWQSMISEGTVEAQPPPKPEKTSSNRGLIAFTAASENGNLDVYTMRPDGSELTNLTKNPAQDVNPFWSPDGRRIAFESDREGFTHIFLMDTDGSNVLQLTSGEAQHQFPNANPWSPDGSRLLFTEWSPEGEKWTLSIIGVDGQNKTPLAQVPNTYINPSWSPDGQQVAFLADDPQNLGGNRIYVVDADGHNRRDLTESLQANEQLSTSMYDWSADGRSIFFVSFLQKTDPSWTVYEARLDDNSLIEHVTTNAPMLDWWKGVSVTGSFNDASAFTWTRSNETVSTLHPYENCQSFDAARSGSYMKRSSNGTWLIRTYCPNGDAWFYWIRSNGTITRQLLDFPIPSEQDTFLDLVWSPDDKFVAFNMFSNNLTEMYILDIAASLDDPSTQPLKTTLGGGNLFYNPSWQPVP
jgi:Tol biopolymer transport system component